MTKALSRAQSCARLPGAALALAALRAVGLSHVCLPISLIVVGRAIRHKGVQRLAGETAKMLNGLGKDEATLPLIYP